jgi:cephalosporin hydroxylase
LLKQIQTAPDVIIDDGLHTKEAQIATLRNFFPALRAGGLYVVEDVWPDSVPEILENLARLHPGCPFFVDRSSGAWVAIVIRKPKTEPSWTIDYSVKQQMIPKKIDDLFSYLARPARAFGRLFQRR